MNQLAFELDPPRARHSDPSTSHGAAIRAKQLQAAHVALILGALQRFGPMTVDQIADIVKLNGHQVGKRMSGLAIAKAVEIVPELTRPSKAGRAQRVWRRKA